MSRAAICLLLQFVVNVISVEKSYYYELHNLKVPLDHFSFVNDSTFDLRYFLNDTFDPTNEGPILFFAGSENDVERFTQNSGFVWELAETLKARIVFAEHRYYGKSLPFGERSFESPETLGFLTSEQALADYADLLVHLNPDFRPVIAIGGSYGGMLAYFMRLKYPHLVTGSLAASAPILQFEVPCETLIERLTEVYENASLECAKNIRNVWLELITRSLFGVEAKDIQKRFKTCKNFEDSRLDVELAIQLSSYTLDALLNLAMMNHHFHTYLFNPLPPYPIRAFCNPLKDPLEGKDLLYAFHESLSVYSNFTGTLECLDIESIPTFGSESWKFQCCTQFVTPFCSYSDKHLVPNIPWSFRGFSNVCFKHFGVRPRLKAEFTRYGGRLGIKEASNVIFTNGDRDPWIGGGVLETTNDRVKVLIIEGAAHHAELFSSREDDSEKLKEARKVIRNEIDSWIRSGH